MTTQLLQIRNDSKYLLEQNSQNHLLNWTEYNKLVLTFYWALFLLYVADHKHSHTHTHTAPYTLLE